MRFGRKAAFGCLTVSIAGLSFLAGGAFGTPPLGQIGAVLGRGTTSDTLQYDVPMDVTITTKVRIKRHGKFVLVNKKVKQTVQRPIIACGGGSACDVVQQKIAYPAGSSSGWHSHPGMVFGVVTSGSVTAYSPDCAKQTYSAGQTFVEMGPTSIRNVKNESSAPAEVLATLIVSAGTPNPGLRIDQPQPASCSA